MNCVTRKYSTQKALCHFKTLFCFREMQASYVFLLCLLSMFVNTVNSSAFLCFPQDPTSCGYGGTCTSASTIPQLMNGNYDPGLYLCKCPPIDCMAVMELDPVCGSDGITYYNDVCRRTKECVIQAPIYTRCKGACNDPNCQPVARTPKCALEDWDFCKNFGECLTSQNDSSSKYCKCLPGFTGQRCASKILSKQNENGKVATDDVNYKLAFLCSLGALALVLLLQTIYCVIRCDASSPKKESFDLNVVKTSAEQQEAAESTRSCEVAIGSLSITNETANQSSKYAPGYDQPTNVYTAVK